MPACPVPVMAERESARLEEELRRQETQRLAQERERAERLAQRERMGAPHAAGSTTDEQQRPRWGTPQARRQAMLELQRRIDTLREHRKDQNQD